MFGLPLSPRYRLDDEHPWLVGIDPIRRYWIQINGEASMTIALAGLQTESFEDFRNAILDFRAMEPGTSLSLLTALDNTLDIHCIADNCFAVEGTCHGAAVVHLFDRESIESLLMTAHPDWRCAPEHLHLGRNLLTMSWQEPVAKTVENAA